MSTVKQVWSWLGTYKAARILSVIACVFLSIAAIGNGRDYWMALDSCVTFFAIWMLGHNSRKDPS